jgi:3-methyladenine DNA glycosylase AlkD
MTVEEVMSELRRLGAPQRVAALKRSAAASPAFGVSLPELRALAKRIGHDHELALALWQTPVREARILASLIDERERVTEKQMDRWAEAFDSWEICDQCCQNLFAHTAFAPAKTVEWTQRPEEFVKRAGFVLAAADDERLYVRKGASWALRQIGKRSDQLRARVLDTVTPCIDSNRRGAGKTSTTMSR